jgi:hypothetical protein
VEEDRRLEVHFVPLAEGHQFGGLHLRVMPLGSRIGDSTGRDVPEHPLDVAHDHLRDVDDGLEALPAISEIPHSRSARGEFQRSSAARAGGPEDPLLVELGGSPQSLVAPEHH